MRIYKTTFIRHLRAMTYIYILLGLFPIIALLMGLPMKSFSFLALVLSITYLPGIYLHIEYTYVDFRKILEINTKEIRVLKNNDFLFYSLIEDLKEIHLYRSATMEGFSITFTMQEYYYYYKLITKSG